MARRCRSPFFSLGVHDVLASRSAIISLRPVRRVYAADGGETTYGRPVIHWCIIFAVDDRPAPNQTAKSEHFWHTPSPPHLLSTESTSVSLYGVSLSPRRSFRPLFVNSTWSDVHGPTNGLVSMVQPGGGSAPQPEDARVNNSASIDLRTKKCSTDTDERTHQACLLPSRPDLAGSCGCGGEVFLHPLTSSPHARRSAAGVCSFQTASLWFHSRPRCCGRRPLCFCVFPPALGRGLSWNDSAISGNVGCWF